VTLLWYLPFPESCREPQTELDEEERRGRGRDRGGEENMSSLFAS